MTHPDKQLCTPIRFKTAPKLEFPKGEVASYILARNGLFLRRHHLFFTSVVPARNWPQELETQEPYLESRFPKIARVQFERIVGFFDEVRYMYGAEAAVLLAWDPKNHRVRLICPEQIATMGKGWSGGTYPIGLEYTPPTDLDPEWVVFGSVHSHVDAAAYASGTDKLDESYFAGLHIVVGRLYLEVPEVHIEAVVDGMRFPVEYAAVIGGFEQRRTDYPAGWLDRLEVEVEKPWSSSYGGSYGASSYGKPSDLGSGSHGGGSHGGGSYGSGSYGGSSYGSTKYGSGSSSSAKGSSGSSGNGGPKGAPGKDPVDPEPELSEEGEE